MGVLHLLSTPATVRHKAHTVKIATSCYKGAELRRHDPPLRRCERNAELESQQPHFLLRTALAIRAYLQC